MLININLDELDWELVNAIFSGVGGGEGMRDGVKEGAGDRD